MREIKFRAWNKIDKTMSEMCGNYYSYSPYNDENKYVWMQFTGLKDKSGTEIYEGDILQYTDDDEVIGAYEMYWDDMLISWQLRYKDCSSWIKQFEHQFEVIGNIHENPELLEVK